jgi:hypothetical protein
MERALVCFLRFSLPFHRGLHCPAFHQLIIKAENGRNCAFGQHVTVIPFRLSAHPLRFACFQNHKHLSWLLQIPHACKINDQITTNSVQPLHPSSLSLDISTAAMSLSIKHRHWSAWSFTSFTNPKSPIIQQKSFVKLLIVFSLG